MPTLVTLHLEVELDGHPVPGFPYVRRLALDDSQLLAFLAEPRALYASAPIQRLKEVAAVVLLPDQTICVRLNGAREGDIVVQEDGTLIVWNTLLDAGPSDNVRVLRFSLDGTAAAATVTGMAGGVSIDADYDPTPAAEDSGFGEGGFE